ncbi:MAG: hypothetical protein Q9M33_11755 [Robiginitomaculum sp.]|nr:hypothetical protein [Robiginitomaculum sp.]MDQ7078512.1 hypothetical protein [Robiginitomaculum sp.]
MIESFFSSDVIHDKAFKEAVFIVMFGLSSGALSYPFAAKERGWTVGSFYLDSESWPNIMAFTSMIASVALTLFKIGWLYVPVTVILGYALMVLLLKIFKSFFQVIALSLFIITPLAIGFLGLRS